MNSTAYYEAFAPGIAWWMPAAAAIGSLILGVVVTAWSRRKVVGFIILGFAVLFSVTAMSVVARFRELRRASRDPATPVVEGVVRKFRPAPREGHQDESFEVNGVPFAYSYFVHTGGYNRTAPYGGIMREGLSVRIRYRRQLDRNVIVTIDTAGY